MYNATTGNRIATAQSAGLHSVQLSWLACNLLSVFFGSVLMISSRKFRTFLYDVTWHTSCFF